MKKSILVFIILIAVNAFAEIGDIKPKQNNKRPTRCYLGSEAIPIPIKQVAPNYPDSLKAKKIEGTVWLQCIVKKDGTVGKVEVLRPLHKSLDNEAIKALKLWKFEPAKSGGKPIAVWVKLPFEFKINDEKNNRKK